MKVNLEQSRYTHVLPGSIVPEHLSPAFPLLRRGLSSFHAGCVPLEKPVLSLEFVADIPLFQSLSLSLSHPFLSTFLVFAFFFYFTAHPPPSIFFYKGR